MIILTVAIGRNVGACRMKVQDRSGLDKVAMGDRTKQRTRRHISCQRMRPFDRVHVP